ncbi:polysaccharide deacetylase family protein [Sesbania bispinosa]|nr:polysaccharide deacetylase family protein [Sesbania bispinosa]
MHNIATRSKVAKEVKGKSPTWSRHNTMLRQKSRTKLGVGQIEAQLHVKNSPRKAGLGDSEAQDHLKKSPRTAGCGAK